MLIKFSSFRLSCAILSSVCLNEAITFAFLLQVFLWDMDKYTMIRKLEGHHHDVVACDFSPDGALLATASYDTRVYIWDPHTGNILMEFGWVQHEWIVVCGSSLAISIAFKKLHEWLESLTCET